MKNSLRTITSLLCSVCILAHSEATEQPAKDAVDDLISNNPSLENLNEIFDTACKQLLVDGHRTVKDRILEKLKNEIDDKHRKRVAELKKKASGREKIRM